MMLEHFKGDEVFVKKILDFKNQAEEYQKMILTPFYNPHEQSIVLSLIGHGDISVKTFGGFLNCESQRMIICPSFYEIEKEDFEIVVVEVIYNQQFGILKHKDILGALMNLGVKRECIGDIYDKDRIYFACTAQTYPYIYQELKHIKRSKIKLKRIEEDIEIVHDFMTKTFFVSSMRLDKMISTLYKISRQKASELIRTGNVKVNHKKVEQVDYLCNNNDMISLKKHGRVKIVDEGKQSKQGNLVITGYFYR